MRIKIPSILTVVRCLRARKLFWKRKFLWIPKRKDHCTVLWLTYIAVRKVAERHSAGITYYKQEIDWDPKDSYDYPGPKIRYYFFYKEDCPPNPPAPL